MINMVDLIDKMRRVLVGYSLNGRIDADTPVDEMRVVAEEAHGTSQRFAVPIYNSRTERWISNPQELCDPLRDYAEAIGKLTKLS